MVKEKIILWKNKYQDCSLDPIPLIANSKKPMKKKWQLMSTKNLWNGLDEDLNIGIRCGGFNNLVVIDCDNKKIPETSNSILNWLTGLGLLEGDFPEVQTASRIGRHFYFRSLSKIPGNYRNIHKDFGAGEVRFGPGAYVIAPPSIIENKYELIQGDFSRIPILENQEISQLFGNQNIESPAWNDNSIHLPFKAFELLHGNKISNYRSRSEAEFAIIQILRYEGLGFGEILSLFIKYPCAGKFKEAYSDKPDAAIKWLLTSFNNAERLQYQKNNEVACTINNIQNYVLNQLWSGHSGPYNRVVLLAHICIAKKFNQIEYFASYRDLAEIAGVSHQTAKNATKRLVKDDFLQINTNTNKSKANRFKLEKSFTKTQENNMCLCNTFFNQDCFRYEGLGKTGEIIYSILHNQPMTIKEIVARTKLSIPTVRKRLNQMHQRYDNKYISVEPMVEYQNGLWLINPSHDLNAFAKYLGTFGKGDYQKRRHFEERLKYNNLDEERSKGKMKNHRLVTESELIRESGLSKEDLISLKKIRLVIPDNKKENLYREKLIPWCRKLSDLIKWGWSLQEIKVWAKKRWEEDDPREWPPDHLFWKHNWQKMIENDKDFTKSLDE